MNQPGLQADPAEILSEVRQCYQGSVESRNSDSISRI